MSEKRYFKASGTRSFFDVLRHPGNLLGGGESDASADIDRLRQGLPIAVSAFLMEEGKFVQGMLVLGADGRKSIIWERYRFLLGYKPARSLSPPYEIRYIGRVAGRGAWNVDRLAFRAINLRAAGDWTEVAVPERDLDFMRYAIDWLNGDIR